MNKFAFAMVGAAAIALAGCGGQGDDALGENVQENMENQADQLRDEGNAREEAIDDADVNAAEADSAVNGM